MKLNKFLQLIDLKKYGSNMLCIRDEESDFYIGTLDGKTNQEEYEALQENEVIGFSFDTTAISGNERVEIDMEVVVNQAV